MRKIIACARVSLDGVMQEDMSDGFDLTLYPPLLEANLIDRLQLLTLPIVLGKGKKLFGSISHPVTMKLVGNEISSTGVIIVTYEPKGSN